MEEPSQLNSLIVATTIKTIYCYIFISSDDTLNWVFSPCPKLIACLIERPLIKGPLIKEA